MCEETFEKSCSNSFKQQALNETVRKCYRPTGKVCNGQGEEVYQTVYESSCTTKYIEKQPGKFVGDTGCEKLPVEICGAGCTFEEGPEECHDKVLTYEVDMLEEVCDLNPQKKCRSVTKLVLRLKSTHRCTIVPQEICQLQFSSPLQPGEIYPPEEKLFFACAAAQQADQIETVIKPYIEWGVKEKSETSADFDTEIPRPNSPEKDAQKNTTPGIKGLRAPKF